MRLNKYLDWKKGNEKRVVNEWKALKRKGVTRLFNGNAKDRNVLPARCGCSLIYAEKTAQAGYYSIEPMV